MKSTKDHHEMVIEAAGGLLWRDGSPEREIAIIHRPMYNDWTLPKGKREPGESWQETALREVAEETGYEVEIESYAGAIGYLVKNTPKVVLFWNMRILNNNTFKPNSEVDQLVWMPTEKALKTIQYPDEVELLKSNKKQNRPKE